MSLPAPENYDDWQSYARALVTALGEGNGDVVGTGMTVVSGEGGTGEGTTPLPAGYRSLWFNTAMSELYLGNSAFDPPTAEALFQVDSAQLADAAVSFNKIAAGAVGFSNLITDSVYGTVIKDAAIVTAKIADAAILSAKIGDLQVVQAKIADLAVNSAKIANLAVTSAKIANLAVGTAQIANLAVGNAQIAEELSSDDWNPATGQGWLIDRFGNISGQSLTLVSASGDAMSSSQVFNRFGAVESGVASNLSLLSVGLNQNSINSNPNFTLYPSNAVNATPTSWTKFAGTLGTVQRVAGLSSGYAVSMQSPGGVGSNCAIVNSGAANSIKPSDWLVYEIDMTLVSGGLNNAVLALRYYDGANTLLAPIDIVLANTKTVDGTAPGVSPSTNKTYKWRILSQVPSAAGSGTGYYNAFHVFVDGYFSNAAVNVTLHKASYRAATDAEIQNQTVLGPLTATVTNIALATADLTARTAVYLNRVTAGTGVAEVELIALDSGGVTTSAINLRAAKISLGGFAAPTLTIEAGKATFGTDVYVNNGYLVVNNGTVMKVIGNSFGTAGQFVEWFGPVMAFNLCSEANAISFLKTNGDAYFGGTLSAGVLKNSGQSTGIATNESFTLGPFGTLGDPILVAVSWGYASVEDKFYPGTIAGRNAFDADAALASATSSDGGFNFEGAVTEAASSSTLTLERSIAGGGFGTVASQGAMTRTRAFVGLRPIPSASEAGNATITLNGTISFTYTDTAGGTGDREFRASIARGYTYGAGVITQRVGLIATE